MTMIYATKDSSVSKREIDHMALARRAAAECMVLLENDGTLPLRNIGKLALYGSGARQTVSGGTGSGEVNARRYVCVEEGLENAGFQITTKGWLDRMDVVYDDAKRDYRDRMADYARENGVSEQHAMFTHPFPVPAPPEITAADIEISGTDTAVYVLARISGEGADRHCERGDYLLYEEEREQLELLGQTYENVILVLNTGGVMELSEVKEMTGIGAVLLMAQLGSAAGDALTDVLTGKENPSGKLTDTWAKRYADYPAAAVFSGNDGDVDDEYYIEGIYVGYRYFDTFRIEPLYPFGYGRSYTEFEITPGSVEAEGEIVRMFVSVTNIGSVSGREVVQAYCSASAGAIPKPRQELVCFGKTKLLSPGESETLDLTFSVRDLASYSEERAAWVLEKGEYVLRVGNSSVDTHPAAVLVLDESVTTYALKNLFADDDPVREIEPPVSEPPSMDDSVPRIALCGYAIPTERAVYQEKRKEFATDRTELLTAEDIRTGNCTVEELVAQLTLEEMAELCVGTLRMDGGSVVGNASAIVPGAAGDTSAVLEKSRGIRSMILADGPAGLRLEPVFHTDRDGSLIREFDIQNPLTGSAFAPGAEDIGDTYYQYCTAVPIGWALAQSWNTELLEEVGFMIGAEMEEFGVDLWLAPGMNIHRDPLCGRNFEYYSEDPLVTGKAAAAITRGVQRHAGRGTTIKHFAANSQEDNRYFSNSHVSERALREIYLRGFEIAVRESQPMSVMTSYNLLNGTHTANHRDLLQAVLRDEWGFQGVVMTDWFTSQDQSWSIGEVKTRYPISASTGCIYAGNDIQMPGCQKNVDDIVEAVREGTAIDGYRITLADLQQCAAAVIQTAVKTKK